LDAPRVPRATVGMHDRAAGSASGKMATPTFKNGMSSAGLRL
jgi:hypothetical protein